MITYKRFGFLCYGTWKFSHFKVWRKLFFYFKCNVLPVLSSSCSITDTHCWRHVNWVLSCTRGK